MVVGGRRRGLGLGLGCGIYEYCVVNKDRGCV